MRNAVRVQNTTVDIDYLVNRNPFSLPDFQRGEVWNVQKQSALIASLLQGFSMPPLVTIRGEINRTVHILDGLQRFTAIKKFINDEYKITLPADISVEETLKAQIEKKRFSELPEDLKLQLLQTRIMILEYEVTKEMEDKFFDIALELFKRFNRNPTPLKTGHLLYILTYTKDITPLIDRTIEKLKQYILKDDKNKEIFRSIARYLTLLQNYNDIKTQKVSYPSGKYYSFVEKTLNLFKSQYLNADEKTKEALRKSIKLHLTNFEKMVALLFDHLKEAFYEELMSQEEKKLIEEYIKKHRTSKNLEKFLKTIRKTGVAVKEEKTTELFEKFIEDKAKEYATLKISKKAHKIAQTYFKKVWIGDIFAVFEKKAQDLGYKTIEEFIEKVGKKAFINLLRNKEFREFVQDKKRDNKIWEFIRFGEKAIEQCLNSKTSEIDDNLLPENLNDLQILKKETKYKL